MTAMDALPVVLGLFVALDIAVWRYGADSRFAHRAGFAMDRNDKYWGSRSTP